MSELVSQVMPAWRPREDWLREAVHSALGQQGCEIELIVVDDGSPEPVADLLADIDDERLRIVRVEHGGVSRARNAGIEAARGGYLRFTDADDVYEPESCSRLLALAREGAVAYGATLVCDSELRPLWKMESGLEGDVAEACLLGRFTTRPQSLLFPRGAAEAAGEWDPSLTVSEDWDWVLRALEHAPARRDPEVATLYRRHESGAAQDADAGIEGAKRVVERWFERHPEQRGSRLERRARAMLAARSARILVSHGRRRDAAGLAARSLFSDPRALAEEARQALPVLRGRLSRRPA